VFRAALALALIAGLPAPAQGKGKGGGEQGASGQEHGKGNKSPKAEGQKRTPEQLLERNPKLASKLQGLLSAGTDLKLAASGFRNLGQFVAALHVSRNLGIPFDQLKSQMVDSKLSLGQAIQKLKPTAKAQTEAKKGENQATQDLQAAGLLKKKT